MLVLTLDTATPAVTAGVVRVDADGVQVCAEQVVVDPRRHGELLAPAVRDVIRDAGTVPGEIDAVVAGVGPGPFTGLRVGLVTAVSFADAVGIPTYGVCSLDAVATAADPVTGGRLLVATDARRREVYWAVYADGGRTAGPAVTRPAELAGRLAALGVTAMAGAGAATYADVLGLPLVEPPYPTVAGLTHLAASRVLERGPAEPLTPLYLRRPDAVPPAARKSVTPA
ncbi:MAG TPA: tRNA (adenosine(37)-N6)-threonylcarbamoyltransferase complex dimerization subunit type 1 TsaB [Mycobacteriales bacterium]